MDCLLAGCAPSGGPNRKRAVSLLTGKAPPISEAAGWDDLTRFEQRALIKLFGGGSLRREDPAVVNELRARGFVDGNNALAMPGLLVLTLAMRR
jgi:hypothetical protein